MTGRNSFTRVFLSFAKKEGRKLERKEILKEEHYLETVCTFLNQKVQEMSTKIFKSQEDIQAFRKYVWENKGDMDVAELTSVRTSSEMEAKLLLEERKYFKKLMRIQPSPYFASIIFKEENGEEKMIYIGLTYLKKDEVANYIYDWRAPICSLFYDYEVGECSFLAPEGFIKGNLERKRQYKIEEQKLKRVFDNSLNINDEVLQEVLAENSNEKMKNIVNTIQQEQNAVIRNVRDKNLIVQGIAGSGKTSVALHRIAFLLYKIPNLTSEKILIFSPNQIFTEYISNVLPELGEENTLQTTFHDYLNKIIKEYKSVESFMHFLGRFYQGEEKNKRLIEYKQSEEIIRDLEAYVKDLENTLVFKKDIVENHVFEYSKEELNQMFHHRYQGIPLFERLRMMAEKLSENNYNGSIKKAKTYHKLFLESLEIKKDYIYFLSDFFRSFYFKERVTEEEIKCLKNKQIITYENALLFVYLKGLLEGFMYDRYVEQVVIDEAQDYNFLQYKILSKIFKRANFTILGDINQNINPFYHYETLEKLEELWPSKYILLNKTYRSSEEIIAYTNQILHLSHVSAIRKENKVPVLTHCQNDLESDVNTLQEKYKNMAIVTKDENTARRVYDKIKEQFSISLIQAQTTSFNKDLLIIPAYLAKGLEFDSVIVYQDETSFYTKKEKNLFYVACTRAQHELIVYEPLKKIENSI